MGHLMPPARARLEPEAGMDSPRFRRPPAVVSPDALSARGREALRAPQSRGHRALDSRAMQGYVSFHPVDVAFFDDLVAPLIAGRKVNPESFLVDAARVRRTGWVARRYAVALEGLAAAIEAPKADPAGSVWERLRTNLEKLDHRPDEAVRRAAKVFDRDLHLDGRPFFVTEGSAERVAEAVARYVAAADEETADRIARDQLARLDAELAKALEPVDLPDLSS